MPPSQRPSSCVCDGTLAAAAPAPVLRRALRGDLDNIVLHAVEPEPARRYASAGALADDIARYLAGRPVDAHPPSRWYRTRKFVQRHRGGFAITAALLLGILSALGVALWQAGVALRQEEAARREAQRANAVRDFMEQLFEPVSEGVAEGRQPALRDLVAAGVERLDTTQDLGAAERVDLTMMFSRLESNLGERKRAMQLAEAADELARATLDPLHPKAIAALALRGARHVRDDDHAGGEPLLLEARRRLEAARLGGTTLLTVLDNLAIVEMDRNHEDLALALSRQALDERRRLYGEDGKETATGYNNLGYGLVGIGHFEDAADAYRRAYEIDIRYRDPTTYDVLTGLSNWGWAEARSGRARDGRARLAEVDEGLVKLGGKPRGLHVMNSQKLCILDLQVASPDVGERDCTRMLGLAAQVAGAESQTFALARFFEAARLVSAGDLAAASALLDKAWPAFPDPEQDARERGGILALRAEIAWLRGDAAAARDFALAARGPVRRQRDLRVAWVRLDALLLLACARAPAPQCPDNLLRDFEVDLADFTDSIDTRMILPRLVDARLKVARGDAADAAALLDAVLDKARPNLDEDHPLVATAHVWRAIALDRDGACAAAARELASADAAAARAAEPWFAESRVEFGRLSTCPHGP
jgi:serine/threonine-protein kinase